MKNRAKVFFVIANIMLAFLFFRLLQLQVFENKKYVKLASDNAARTMPIIAPRGIIFDRNGKVLLKNRPVFTVYVLPHMLPKNPEPIFRRLGAILNLPQATILKRFKERKTPIFEGILIAKDVPISAISQIEELRPSLPGLEIIRYPLRFYPYKKTAAHVLGFVGEIETGELSKLKDQGYRLGDLIGKDGIEKVYDSYLRGMAGGKKIEVDALGHPLRILEKLEPVSGNNITLTIDINLQQKLEKLLGRNEGAVVVLDPNTGEILAMASNPSYDASKKWSEIDQRNHPFMNRAISSYPPGSTFKPVVLSAALQEKITTAGESFYCKGYYELGRRIAKCWKEAGHGRITPIEGLVQSCDIVFYELGRRLGPDRIKKYANEYGLGLPTGIDLPGEKKGFLPDQKWKQERFGQKWYEGDSINIGIGQGFIQVTPLQLACMYGQIATGRRMKPFIVKQIKNDLNEVIFENKSELVYSTEISENNLSLVRVALRDIVKRGTGIAAFVSSMEAAGKTGTAENPGIAHAWFLCYAPYNKPQIVISAFVAHGGHGDRVTAHIAKDILKWYAENRKENEALHIF